MCTTIEVIFDNVIVQSPSVDSSNINLVEDTDYTFSNPFNLPIIPKSVELLRSTGEIIETKYAVINQTTGDIIINVGTTYTNAIINTTGW